MIGRRTAVTLACLVGAGCGSPTTPGSSPTPAPDPWEPAMAVGDAGVARNLTNTLHAASALAVTPDGRAVALWSRQAVTGDEVLAATLAPDATAWAGLQRAQQAGALPRVDRVRIALDARGRGWASWVERSTDEARLVARRASAEGWLAEPVLVAAVETEGADIPHDLAVGPEGNAVLAWIASGEVHAALAGDVAWGAPTIVDVVPDGRELRDVSCALRGAVGAVAWLEFRETATRPVTTARVRRFEAGVGWQATRDLRGSNQGQLLPRAAVDANGDVTVVSASLGNASSTRVFRIAGGAWTDMESPQTSAGAPLAADGRGDVLAGFWGSPTFAVVLAWFPAGPLRSEEKVTVTTGSEARNVAVSVNDRGDAAAVFEDRNGPRYAVGSGSSWQTGPLPGARASAACASVSSGEADPLAAVDTRGRILFTWIEWDCARATLRSQRRRAP
jgi:hypothetical protein